MFSDANQPTAAARLPMVFLARHASPDWTRTDIRYDIPPGPPLTPAGEDEAARLGEFLASQGVVKLYASPLERTRRTAEIAARVAAIPWYEAHEIGEWRRDEQFSAVLERIHPFWQQTCAESRHIGPIALISHGGPVLSLLEKLNVDTVELNHYRNQFDHRNPLPPAGAWLTTRDALDSTWDVFLAFTPGPIQQFLPLTTEV
jgi:broad specificity phosphatase PhoE